MQQLTCDAACQEAWNKDECTLNHHISTKSCTIVFSYHELFLELIYSLTKFILERESMEILRLFCTNSCVSTGHQGHRK